MALSPKFGIGDAVFAKMKGYPAWPAKVEGVADGTPNKIKYHVYFYGTKQIAVCRQDELCPYLENRSTLGKLKKYKGFNAAINEMDCELSLGLTASNRELTEPRRAMNEIELACCEVLKAKFQDSSSNGFLKPSIDDVMTTEGLESVVPTLNHGRSTSIFNPSGVASRKRKYDEALNEGLGTNGIPSANPKIYDVHRLSSEENTSVEASDILLSCLKKEIQLLDINLGIQSSLSLNFADPEACLKYLNDLFALQVNTLMLKKHPEIVDTLFKVQNYIGNLKSWKMSDHEVENFSSKAKSIQVKAKLIYDKYQSMFEFPYGKTFLQYFSEEVKKFRELTSSMTADNFYLLVREPEENY